MNETENVVGTIAPPSAITFFGTFAMSDTKVMEITRNGIWVNPDVSVDDSAKTVLKALDSYIKNLVDGAVRAERGACAKVCNDRGGGKKRLASSYDEGFVDGADDCANAIRARGDE